MTTATTPPALRLDDIQGNSVVGFNKDFMTLLVVRFDAPGAGREWIGDLVDAPSGIAESSSARVMEFNARFKELQGRRPDPERYLQASWTSLALSHRGLRALALPAAELGLFPEAFRQGMAARSGLLGDTGANDPACWSPPFDRPADVHAIVVLADDDQPTHERRVEALRRSTAARPGLKVIGTVAGATRADEPGHEHFGFKDGISQPGIRGLTPPDDPIGNPDQGHPGQDLLWPGEFVLGYPTQIASGEAGHDGPNRKPGPASASGPAWTVDGSYLVVRRLAQDVPGFAAHVRGLAHRTGLSEDLMGAKLVGRYKSGCPLERPEFGRPHELPRIDPGRRKPELGDDDALNNGFEFGADADGRRCPLAAHIRKVYPRDGQVTADPADSESESETHRLLRHGIAYGASYGARVGGRASDPRGLLFLSYQSDIERQFEYVQARMVNDDKFPAFGGGSAPGVDAVIASNKEGSFNLEPGRPPLIINRFVTLTGGAYSFAPSVPALRTIARNNPLRPGGTQFRRP